MPGFIALTIVVNAAGVLVLPILCGSLWIITAKKSYIGGEYRNGATENGLLAGLFVLSLWGAYQSVMAILAMVSG